MKTFKQYINEETSFRERVQPAIKHPSGKILRGKRGEDHAEIRERHMKEPGKPAEGEAGFYDPKDKKFYSRSEMGGIDSTRMLTPKEREDRDKRLGRHEEDPFAGSFSSTDKMTNTQRMRRYGTFE